MYMKGRLLLQWDSPQNIEQCLKTGTYQPKKLTLIFDSKAAFNPGTTVSCQTAPLEFQVV